MRAATRRVAVAAAALLAIASDLPLSALEPLYTATAVHVRDGDSLVVSDGTKQRDLRLAEIDAPERGQPWAREAELALTRLVSGKALRVERVERDRYGREVSKVWVGDLCVACELVRGGHAWAFRKYLRDPRLLDLEREARAAKRGLWGDAGASPVPPSAWRHGVRELSAERLARYLRMEVSESGEDAFVCRRNPRCEAMSSCAEARFQLEQCGAAHLDADGDGVPCDERCR